MLAPLVKITVVALTTLALTGCLGYERMGEPYGPGYSETVIAPGVFDVRYNGTGANAWSALERLLARRASELCPTGYLLEQPSRSTETVMERMEPIYRFVQARVRCNEPGANNSSKPTPLRGAA